MSREYPGKRNAELLVDLLVGYKTLISVGLIAGVLAVAYFGVELPQVGLSETAARQVKIAILGVGGGLILGYVPAKKVVEYLYSPDYVWLFEIDAATDDVRLYKLSPQVWEELDVLHGELHQLRAKVPLWACRAYVPDRNTAIGTWRGSATDLELIQDRERIDEIRETLEAQAQRGLSIRIKVGSIVRSAVNDIIGDVIAEVEGATIYRGTRVDEAVSDALKKYELDEPRQGERADERDEQGDERTNGHAPEAEVETQ